MTSKGKLIALESIGAAVLEIQAQRLYRWLNGQGVSAEHTAEPTCGPVGTQILLNRLGRLHIDPLSLALYDVADRMDHLGRADGILSWLADGRYVLCTRYVCYSYARHLDHVDLDWLQKINARCRIPDLTLFFDLEPDSETAGLDRNYKTALDALQSQGRNIAILDGHESADKLFEHCCRHIAALHNPGIILEL